SAEIRLMQLDDSFQGTAAFTTLQTENTVLALQRLAVPMVFMVGLDIAEFAQRYSAWSLRIARDVLARPIVIALLLVAAAWRARAAALHVSHTFGAHSALDALRAFAAAGGLVALVGLGWWLFARRPAVTEGRGMQAEQVAHRAKGGAFGVIVAHLA